MKKLPILTGFLLLLTFATSCKKEGCTNENALNYNEEAKKDDGSCEYAPVADFKSFYDEQRASNTQTFTGDASSGIAVTGVNGTQVFIAPNGLKTTSGAIYSGSVTIELLEVLKPGDMILNNAPTVSDGQLLVSGGEIELRVYGSSGEILRPVYNQVSVYVPTSSLDSEMDLFLGTEDPMSGDISWEMSVDTVVVIDTTVVDTFGGPVGDYYYYNWPMDDFGWINCDYFYEDPSPKTTLTVKVDPETHIYSNTQVFFYVPSINSVASLYWFTGLEEDEFQISNLPIGLTGTIVCISKIDDDYYSSFDAITLSMDHEEDVILTITTLADFEAAIDDL